jgi:tripartite-type tricarboxylate transporter receptor subunit TctC
MTLSMDRRALLAGAAAVATLSALPALAAQTTTLIVPYPPGGAVDILGRILAEKLGPKLGGQVVVENRGGAGGSIGVAALAKAEPDGATLGVLNVTQLIVNKYLYASLPYDPDKDLAPVSRVATGTILCVASAEVAKERGWKTFRDLIAWSKANPDQVRMGSSGVGTISHLGIELVKAKSGASIVHVPYKGGGPALVDLLGGVVEIMFDVIPALAPHVKDGKLVALAVGSRERIAAFPDVPSMKEFAISASARSTSRPGMRWRVPRAFRTTSAPRSATRWPRRQRTRGSGRSWSRRASRRSSTDRRPSSKSASRTRTRCGRSWCGFQARRSSEASLKANRSNRCATVMPGLDPGIHPLAQRDGSPGQARQ